MEEVNNYNENNGNENSSIKTIKDNWNNKNLNNSSDTIKSISLSPPISSSEETHLEQYVNNNFDKSSNDNNNQMEIDEWKKNYKKIY